MRRETKRRSIFTRRALLVGAAQTVAFGAMGANLYRLQVREHGRFATLAKQNSINDRLIAPERGLITDRYGVVLAGNRQHWRALFMMTQAHDPQAVIDRFAALMALSPAERARIARDLAGKPRYVPILLKDDLDWSDMARIEVRAVDLPGVFVDVGASRTYPLGPQASHVIGFVGRPTQAQAQRDPMLALPGMRVGRTGIEGAHDHALRGTPGIVQTEVNVHGSVVREIDRDNGKPGAVVQTALDTGLQTLAATRLAGQAGAAIVIDAVAGEVLAMASTPGFDPGLFDTGVPAATWANWMHDPRRPLTNRAANGLYAPGSTFKPCVAIAALHSGAITAHTKFTCPGYLKLGDHTFYCWQHSGHGTINVVTAIQQSCDVFFYHTALAVGIDRIAAMGRRLGLVGPLDIGMPGASTGFLPTHQWARRRKLVWTKGNTVIQGIGQGFTQVTPLGLATMVARISTGRAVQPRLTRAIGTVHQADGLDYGWPSLGLQDRHLETVREGMTEVVNTPLGTGYASRLTLPGVRMAGKTGTAQVHDLSQAQEKANYNDANLPWKYLPNAFFIAFAPVTAPRYAVSVVVEHGNEGAAASAPIARDLITLALTSTAQRPAAKPGFVAGSQTVAMETAS
ncbi:MAG TPA: penicillin-binding protein 2 [Acidiphilium sp.]|nr:MAG: penicillin-binding protein 2 [Acidiphilium sp. 21-60-14]OYV90459.1 MAG: penicillin-binding protein 2 [Acidiphilium sp. 37-60-79]HQT87732.1 penicillin-binding protein 2 [Acidiphilium sp.]HQU22859.1 penicillin-binding protein 2 [Acidiphilium sp.]